MARSVARCQRTEPLGGSATPVTALILNILVILIVAAGPKCSVEEIMLTVNKG